MKAFINGIWLEGTPEEIDQYRKLSEQEKIYFNINVDSVPEHVKKYGSGTSYVNTDKNNKYTAWF